ncbi:MAG: flagellar basal body P-ring formation protein FlgA [Proteobacteria bacterium]|nr:flagellar basal body P-ring formation protein FlgA [Pseudomonadota bacterium]
MTIDDFVTYLTSAAIAVVLMLAGGSGSHAAELLVSVTVDDSVVRLGDVFDDAGSSANVAIAEAPAPGMKSRIAVTELVLPTQRAGITWQAPRGVTHVSVLRAGSPVTIDELRHIIGERIKRDGYASSFDITLIGQARAVLIPVNAVPGDIGVSISSYDVRSGNFVASLALPTGTALNRRVVYRGKIEEMVYVPGLNRQVMPGEAIGESDIAWVRLPKRQLGRNMVQSKQALIGMTPRRPLAVNRAIRLGDIQRPLLVKKGARVSVSYKTGNLIIMSMARALENGAKGDVIRILNTRSKQALEGVVTGHDRVELTIPDRVALSTR